MKPSIQKTAYLAVFLGLTLISSAMAQSVSVNATSGFTGWTEQNTSGNGSLNGRFTAASGTSMDTGGNSWGLYANSSQTAANIYNFGSTLAVGGYVEISVSLGNIASGGTVGFSLQNSGGTNRFESYYIGVNASDTFKLNDAGGQENITGPTTSFASSSWASPNFQFQTIRFTLGASNTYTLSFDGVNVTNTGLTIAASDISRIRIFNFNAGSGGASNQYFNSLTVVPEPSTSVLLGLAGAALVAFRRRRVS